MQAEHLVVRTATKAFDNHILIQPEYPASMLLLDWEKYRHFNPNPADRLRCPATSGRGSRRPSSAHGKLFTVVCSGPDYDVLKINFVHCLRLVASKWRRY